MSKWHLVHLCVSRRPCLLWERVRCYQSCRVLPWDVWVQMMLVPYLRAHGSATCALNIMALNPFCMSMWMEFMRVSLSDICAQHGSRKETVYVLTHRTNHNITHRGICFINLHCRLWRNTLCTRRTQHISWSCLWWEPTILCVVVYEAVTLCDQFVNFMHWSWNHPLQQMNLIEAFTVLFFYDPDSSSCSWVCMESCKTSKWIWSQASPQFTRECVIGFWWHIWMLCASQMHG